MILQEAINSVYGMTCNNVYVDLHGHIRPRRNPTPGLYYFDGQFFFRRNFQLDTYRLEQLVRERFDGRAK